MKHKETITDLKGKNAPVPDKKIEQDGTIGAVAAGATMAMTVGAAAGLAAGGPPGMVIGAAIGATAGAIATEAAMESITTETPLNPQKKKS